MFKGKKNKKGNSLLRFPLTWKLWKQNTPDRGGNRAPLRECAKEGEVMIHMLYCAVQPPIAVGISNVLENFQKSYKANLTLGNHDVHRKPCLNSCLGIGTPEPRHLSTCL